MKSLHDAMLDPDLFGPTFGGETFASWRAVARMLEGLPLEESQLALWRQITDRQDPPTVPFSEGYIIKPRRAGGTLFAAAVALHAAIQDYRDRLGPGEFATVALIASDRRQARQALNYVKGLIADSELIKPEVSGETAESITFAHRVKLEVHTTSFRSTRGYSYAAAILDELAFFRDNLSANPDIELVRAVRPEFRNDVAQWMPDEFIDVAIVPGRTQLPCDRRFGYSAFVDVSGDVSDAAVLGIAHAEPGRRGQLLVLDRLAIEPAPHEPYEIVGRFAAELQNFGIRRVTGDRYSAGWVVNALKHYSITYEPASIDKSAIYSEAARSLPSGVWSSLTSSASSRSCGSLSEGPEVAAVRTRWIIPRKGEPSTSAPLSAKPHWARDRPNEPARAISRGRMRERCPSEPAHSTRGTQTSSGIAFEGSSQWRSE
jgi:hypothetical protein